MKERKAQIFRSLVELGLDPDKFYCPYPSDISDEAHVLKEMTCKQLKSIREQIQSDPYALSLTLCGTATEDPWCDLP